MTLTLDVTDAGDGTGGVATVSGSSGADNTLCYAPWSGSMGAMQWTVAGTRTGDGTITIASPSPVPLGYYLWQVVSVSGGVTSLALAYQNLTLATTAFLKQALDGVVARIRSLALAGVSSVNVMERWYPRLRPAQSLPAIIVFPGKAKTFPGVLTGTDDAGLPVGVACVKQATDDEAADIGAVTKWAEQIERSLMSQRLAGVPQVIRAAPEPGPIFDQGQFAREKVIVSSLGFRFTVRLTRGLT